MNITAWIILGLAVAMLAGRLVPESRTWGPPALPAIIGMAGAVTGGWTASILIARPFTGRSLSLATWPAAVAGAAALLAVRWLLTGRHRVTGRKTVTVPVRRAREPR